MSDQNEEIEAYLQSLIAARQKAQILRVRDKWEPEIVDALTSLADESLALLRQHLASRDASGSQEARWLAGKLAALKDQHTQRALALLTDLAAKDGKVTSEIASFDGLAPGLEKLGLSAEELADEPTLRQAVERSYADYLRRVKEVSRQALISGASSESLSQALAEPTRIWGNGLRRIAVTQTHAVFNHAKVEVGMVYIRRAA